MQARYYDPVIGRFYSNDPVGWNPRNPIHSFGRYTYANNNPYKYTDPTGMEGEETYKKEIVKPVYKEVVSKVDMVISMDQVDGSTISTSTDGSSSKSRSINLDGPISAGSSTDLATGKKTTSISFGKQVGLDELNVTPSVIADSNGGLTGEIKVKVGPGAIAVQATTPIGTLIHNAITVFKQAADTAMTSPTGN